MIRALNGHTGPVPSALFETDSCLGCIESKHSCIYRPHQWSIPGRSGHHRRLPTTSVPPVDQVRSRGTRPGGPPDDSPARERWVPSQKEGGRTQASDLCRGRGNGVRSVRLTFERVARRTKLRSPCAAAVSCTTRPPPQSPLEPKIGNRVRFTTRYHGPDPSIRSAFGPDDDLSNGQI
jgi:hypothetical protein